MCVCVCVTSWESEEEGITTGRMTKLNETWSGRRKGGGTTKVTHPKKLMEQTKAVKMANGI